jgi:hypothetical protein
VNRVDRVVFGSDTPVGHIGVLKRPVFASAAASVPTWSPELEKAIDDLDLKADESVHLYRNGVVVYSQPRSIQELLEIVAKTIAIAAQLPADQAALNLDDLPPEFSGLAALIRKWGESDDDARSARMARTSTAQLRALVTALHPHFDSIKAHLDSFGDGAMPQSAIALGALAESAAEAHLTLGEREVVRKQRRQLAKPSAKRKADA